MKYIALINPDETQAKSKIVYDSVYPLHEYLENQTLDANNVIFFDGITVNSMYIINTLEVGEILYNSDGGLDLIRIL